MPRFFNPLLSVWISDETLFLLFDILVLFDCDQSYSLYDIILLIQLFLFFIFAGLSASSWKYSLHYQTPGVTVQKTG